jgi:hypothetical protein
MSPLQSLVSNPVSSSASGTPAIPHAKFWGSMPGLISDGVYFSICQCFGMRGGSGSAYSTIQSSGGYGAV